MTHIKLRAGTVATLSILLLLSMASSASAHATVTSADGKIKVIWGWLNEPATTMTKNGLDLIIRDNATNAGLPGMASAGLEVTLLFGETEMKFEKIQAQHGKEAEGRYTGPHPITPTEAGIYVLKIKGTINGSEIDLTIPSNHEMTAIEDTYWPTKVPSIADVKSLQDEIETLKAQVAVLQAKAQTQSQTPATVTEQTPAGDSPVPGIGIVGIVLAGLVVLALRRRS